MRCFFTAAHKKAANVARYIVNKAVGSTEKNKFFYSFPFSVAAPRRNRFYYNFSSHPSSTKKTVLKADAIGFLHR